MFTGSLKFTLPLLHGCILLLSILVNLGWEGQPEQEKQGDLWPLSLNMMLNLISDWRI
jgi:hypothetical protein